MYGRFVYFHGFASGPKSRKALFFKERLAAVNRTLETPDLAAGDFENLTIAGQLSVAERLLDGEPCTLIGSSLGGYLAALYASRHPETQRLILLAPAFHFAQTWQAALGNEKLEEWRNTGARSFYHYGEGQMRPLAYRFVEESRAWDPAPAFPQPCHIFHGLQDTVVSPQLSRDYVAEHPHVQLTEVASDHELTGALEQIWAVCALELATA